MLTHVIKCKVYVIIMIYTIKCAKLHPSLSKLK